MTSSNQRRADRHSVSVEVEIDVEGTTIQATATNISRQGIGIQALKSIPPGTQATIKVSLPEEIVLYANLMWSRHTLDRGLDAYQMGFEIYAMIYDGKIHDEPAMRDKVIQAIADKR